MLANVRTHCVGPDEQVVIVPLAQPKTAKVEGDLNGAEDVLMPPTMPCLLSASLYEAFPVGALSSYAVLIPSKVGL